MYFYEVGLNDKGLKQHQSLTYSHDEELLLGDVVRVPIRNKLKNGIVLEQVAKPTYATKSIDSVLSTGLIPPHLIELSRWISSYYGVDLGTTLGLVMPRGAEKKRRSKTFNHEQKLTKDTDNSLSVEQESALKAISSKADTYLLHGETGTGKSRVYIELVKKTRTAGLGAILLVPEIGLTSQMVDECISHLGTENVFITHSHQTEAERHAQWNHISESKTPLVIGPRSALFSPIKNLGLIVVDEEHETSYKQEVSPKYHAVRVASKLRVLTGATLVLGSATPSVDDYSLAKPENIVRMSTTIKPLHTAEVIIVDNKQRDQFSRNSWISTPLIDAISVALESEKQTMIFHNRRGTSTSVICEDCGFVAVCPDCELPLTHHADWGTLVCHICNHSESILRKCPDCKSPELVYKGAGTKEIESNLKRLFPKASIERFDSDISDKSETLASRYNALVAGDVDIIIGTQMVAKGLDLPKLSVVGVINADMALYLPDYSSSERSYQLIRQVIGRAGRHQDGKVFLQTYNPKSPSLAFAVEKNWDDFYASEIVARKSAKYPPFRFLLKLVCEEKTSELSRETAAALATALQKGVSDIQVLGPTPSFHHKTRTGWRWQLVIKAENRNKLVNIAKQLPAGWQFELDPINLL